MKKDPRRLAPILLVAVLALACSQRKPTVGYDGYVIPPQLQRELGELEGRSPVELPHEPGLFEGWGRLQHSGFYVGPNGPQAILRSPDGELLAFPIRCDADAHAYMRIFGVESAPIGKTSAEFDATLLRINPTSRR